jgi:hypothetical protein
VLLVFLCFEECTVEEAPTVIIVILFISNQEKKKGIKLYRNLYKATKRRPKNYYYVMILCCFVPGTGGVLCSVME